MSEDRVEPRESSWRQRLPWLEIFQGFRVALDFNKLLLAATGIVVMAFGWWLLAVIFRNSVDRPDPTAKQYNTAAVGKDETERQVNGWQAFKQDRQRWDLLHYAAGRADAAVYTDAGDLADTWAEYQALRDLKDVQEPTRVANAAKQFGPSFRDKLNTLKAAEAAQARDAPDFRKPSGALSTWPWFEDRGTNPYLMLTGQARSWERGGFWDWLFRVQVPVLLEPLAKVVRPILLFFRPNAGPLNSFYFLLVLLWTVLTWALFGGAITRIAAVQVARQEKITLGEALRFTVRRWLSYLTAPLFPLAFVFFLLIFTIIFGIFHLVPAFGDFFDGLLWPVILIFGLLMAVALIGLVGWPLMSATISSEGTDSWEAVSRAYSYVFQAPWHYLWNWVVALAYGAVLVLFVGFMGSFAVYLGKWGISKTPFTQTWNRQPDYLFVYAPTSFGWRNLALQGVHLEDGTPLVNPQTGQINEAAYSKYLETLHWWNVAGAFLVAVWLFVFFLLILGFNYSFFWSASTIIYLLMRRKVDDAELDEVYLEEDEDAYGGPLTAPLPQAPAPQPAAAGPARSMVEAPTLRQPAAPAAPPAPASPPGATASAPPPPATPAPAPTPAPPAAAPAPPPEPEPPVKTETETKTEPTPPAKEPEPTTQTGEPEKESSSTNGEKEEK
jgi:hypothetical protein